MKTAIKIIMLAAIATSAVSCNGRLDPDRGQRIVFSAGLGTKAFLNSGDINVAGTELAVYGYDGTEYFISGKPATYAASSAWTMADSYYWASDKSYTFFAWLNRDKDGHSAPAGLTMNGRKLTLPERDFNLVEEDNYFDFCYSDVVYRPSAEADHSVVNLNMSHLYTAIGFSAHNYTGSTIEVKEVRLVKLKNNKSASITFADTGAEVAYGTCSCNWLKSKDDNVPSKTLNTRNFTLVPGAECANIVGNVSTTPRYYMFWPQTSDELTAEGWSDSDRRPSGGAYIKVVYNKGGGDITRYAQFPQEKDGAVTKGWPAGTKRMMQIAFRDDWFTLQVASSPWDYSEPTVKYDDEVSIASPLQFDSGTCTVDEATHRVYFNGANPIVGSFKFEAPSEATWIISKEGDYDAFEIDNATIGGDGQPASKYGDQLDCNYGSVDVAGGNRFTLYPMPVGSGRDYSIQLTFSVRYPDGESYCIDDKIQVDGSEQPVKWTIILSR